jgi:hypothetical protein
MYPEPTFQSTLRHCCCSCPCQTQQFPHLDANPAGYEEDSLIPKPLLLETIWTIELLFPLKDKHEPNWIDEKEKAHIYGTVTELMEDSPPDDLYQYNYYRDRLLELYEEYNSPPPRFLTRYDRNNPLQWYAFWGSVLVGVVGLVLGILVFGTIQALSNVKAIHGRQTDAFSTVVTVMATAPSGGI